MNCRPVAAKISARGTIILRRRQQAAGPRVAIADRVGKEAPVGGQKGEVDAPGVDAHAGDRPGLPGGGRPEPRVTSAQSRGRSQISCPAIVTGPFSKRWNSSSSSSRPSKLRRPPGPRKPPDPPPRRPCVLMSSCFRVAAEGSLAHCSVLSGKLRRYGGGETADAVFAGGDKSGDKRGRDEGENPAGRGRLAC